MFHRKQANTSKPSLQGSRRSNLAYVDTQRGRGSGRESPLWISQGFFPWSEANEEMGGNEADDESRRKIKTSNQRQLRNQLELGLQRGGCSESVMMWKLQLRG